ncbi:MAG: fatty acid desaturase [Actinobacteria bacterium]|nr:fatty acid desaturase [Actinomycetota bacterium]
MADSDRHDELVATMTGGMAPAPPPFSGSDRLHPDGRPRGAFRDELRHIPVARNVFTVLGALATPVLIVWAAVTLAHPVAWVAAFPAMALAQNRLFILHHEAAHRVLFPNRRINDAVGITMIGWLTFGTGSHGYRLGHINHHRDEFGPREPDFLLYSLYPITRSSMRRKITRDATGVSAFRIVRPRFQRLGEIRHRRLTYRFLLGQALIAAAFALAGHPWLYLLLWVLPWAFVYQVLNRLRAIAEHGGMTRSDDRRRTSRHVRQSLLYRLLIVPCNVGYHLAHHVDMTVPMWNLRRLHAALVDDGYVGDLEWPSYRTLWKAQRSRPVEPAAA